MLVKFLLTPKLLKYQVLLRESGDDAVTLLHNHAALSLDAPTVFHETK